MQMVKVEPIPANESKVAYVTRIRYTSILQLRQIVVLNISSEMLAFHKGSPKKDSCCIEGHSGHVNLVSPTVVARELLTSMQSDEAGAGVSIFGQSASGQAMTSASPLADPPARI